MELIGLVVAISTTLLAVVVAVAYGRLVCRVTVHEYEVGLLYRHGKFQRRLSSGVHRYLRFSSEIALIDLRVRSVTVAGQELLSSDNVGLKMSLALSYSVENPETALHMVQNYVEALYLASQLELRSVVGSTKIDELLAKRGEMGAVLVIKIGAEAAKLGLKLHSAEIKDVMFPGELKKIFAEVVKAQKEGQAALERARGESAALRHLANAAKMLDDNPALFNLRLLQSLSNSGGNNGNSIVVGMPSGVVPIVRKSQE